MWSVPILLTITAPVGNAPFFLSVPVQMNVMQDKFHSF